MRGPAGRAGWSPLITRNVRVCHLVGIIAALRGKCHEVACGAEAESFPLDRVAEGLVLSRSVSSDGSMTLIQQRFASFAQDMEVPFLDLLPSYRESLEQLGCAIDELFLDPLHPTPLGHEIAARHIHKFLEAGGWLE